MMKAQAGILETDDEDVVMTKLGTAVAALGIEEQRVRATICDGGVRDARVREVRSRTDAAESTVLRLQQRAATERRPSSDAELRMASGLALMG